MCKIIWQSILILGFFMQHITICFSRLINHTVVDHLCTFVLPATLQMQISLSKLSSIVELSVARISCLYIFMSVLLEYCVQEDVSEYTHLYGSMYFTSVVYHLLWVSILFSFHPKAKVNSVFLLLLRTHFGHYNPPSLDMYHHPL